MRQKIFAGDRLRRLRDERMMSQSALAGRIGISSSYLSQIEADQRPLTRSLVLKVAEHFGVKPDYFAEAEDLRLATDVREAGGDPFFSSPMSMAEATAVVRAAPGVARGFLDLYRAYLALEEEHRSLQTQLASEQAGSASRFPYDEVRDWVQTNRNYFDDLDRAAESLSVSEKLSGENKEQRLVAYLGARHGFAVAPGALGDGMIWRLDREARTLHVSEGAATESRVFWIAHVIGLLEQDEAISRLVRQARLSNPEAEALARVGLANYFAGALLMPYTAFLSAARSNRYDIERLQTAFGTSFEQVSHRLSTMQRASAPGIPFYFLKIDIAGNILKRSSATRFQFARFGGPCPLWNVHQAFALPGRTLVQLARTPDGASYLCIARTVGGGAGSYLARPRAVAVGLGCEVSFAAQTVYSIGLDLTSEGGADLIGPGCRACERADCRHRTLPPIGHVLDVGTVERGVVPYKVLPH
jgi:predicted transcriptional regulator/DNA-binding XRE family transcriptional regulator